MNTIQLTAEVEQRILAAIRAGAYPHVAAEAAGVPRQLFRRWLRQGKRRPDRTYGPFYRHVRQAQAQARLKAEIDARDKDVRFWLRYGPGKESADNPGWTSTVKPRPLPPADTGARTAAQWNALLARILQVLTAFPEARAALIEAMQNEKG